MDRCRGLALTTAMLCALLVVTTASAEGDPWAPPEGQEASREEGLPHPKAEPSEARARLFVKALKENDPEVGLPFFFPRDTFGRLKAIKDPDRTYRRLLRVYKEDLAAMRKTLKRPDEVEFVAFKLGRQKNWIPRAKEGNAYPYWAVYKSTITVKDGERTRELPMRVMINWGDQWYVTHLTHK